LYQRAEFVAQPTRQPSRWSDMNLDLANSVTASPDVLQPGSDTRGRLQPSGSEDTKFVVQEEMQPRSGDRRLIIKAVSPEHDLQASPRDVFIPTPAFLAEVVPVTAGQPQRGKWQRRSSSAHSDFKKSNNSPLQHRGPSRDTRDARVVGNCFPIVSANKGPNRVPLPAQSSPSVHRQVFSAV